MFIAAAKAFAANQPPVAHAMGSTSATKACTACELFFAAMRTVIPGLIFSEREFITVKGVPAFAQLVLLQLMHASFMTGKTVTRPFSPTDKIFALSRIDVISLTAQLSHKARAFGLSDLVAQFGIGVAQVVQRIVIVRV